MLKPKSLTKRTRFINNTINAEVREKLFRLQSEILYPSVSSICKGCTYLGRRLEGPHAPEIPTAYYGINQPDSGTSI